MRKWSAPMPSLASFGLCKAHANIARRWQRCPCTPWHSGGLRIGIVHGDAESLAGWGFAHDQLDLAGTVAFDANIRKAGVDALRYQPHLPARLASVCIWGGDQQWSGGHAQLPGHIAAYDSHGRTPSPMRPVYGIHAAGCTLDAVPLSTTSADGRRSSWRSGGGIPGHHRIVTASSRPALHPRAGHRQAD